jgi:hypothetical protein
LPSKVALVLSSHLDPDSYSVSERALNRLARTTLLPVVRSVLPLGHRYTFSS